MHKFEIKYTLEKKLIRISRKDNVLYAKIIKKMKNIINTEKIEHYKNLRNDMKDSKRVHIGHFVLIFSYNKSTGLLCFEDVDHHDNIYK